MKRKGIGTTFSIIIMVVVIAAVAVGGYLMLSDGLTGEEAIDAEDLSDLKFEFGEVRGENVQSRGAIKISNIDDEKNLRMRVDFSEEESYIGKVILNRELEKLWVYFGEVPPGENIEEGWYAMSGVPSGMENSLIEMRNDVLEGIPENWEGKDFTIENGQIKIYNVEVNPTFDEDLFEVENYSEIPEVQY